VASDEPEKALTVCDATANNPAGELDFARPH